MSRVEYDRRSRPSRKRRYFPLDCPKVLLAAAEESPTVPLGLLRKDTLTALPLLAVTSNGASPMTCWC